MAAESLPTARAIGGFNLENYFPSQHNCYSTVYVHKKFLPKPETNTFTDKQTSDVVYKNVDPKNRKHKLSDINEGGDSSAKSTRKLRNNSILDQTIKFAKNIAPIAIPPSREISSSPVFYTIKTTQKTKKLRKKDISHTENVDKGVNKYKEKTKPIYRKEKVRHHHESSSARESFSKSSLSNTLDDVNLNPSLCCSLSESSEQKHVRKHQSYNINKTSDRQKLAISESFEVLANEIITSNNTAKLKIHLMNETEKNNLSESIGNPVLKSVKDCLNELNNFNHVENLQKVHKSVWCNMQKIDALFVKLSDIERKIDSMCAKPKDSVTVLHKRDFNKKKEKFKGSKLDELGIDLDDVQEESSFDEDGSEFQSNTQVEQPTEKDCIVTPLSPYKNKSDCVEKFATDSVKNNVEMTRNDKDRINACPYLKDQARIPARYCWTDSVRN